MYGVLDDSLHVLLPAEYRDIELLDDYLVADKPDGVQLQIAYDGRILNKNVYHDVTSLDYDTMERAEDGEGTIMKPTGIYRYGSYNLYGLMDEKESLLLPPSIITLLYLAKIYSCVL